MSGLFETMVSPLWEVRNTTSPSLPLNSVIQERSFAFAMMLPAFFRTLKVFQGSPRMLPGFCVQTVFGLCRTCIGPDRLDLFGLYVEKGENHPPGGLMFFLT
jgi:hypothetical protein